jgi:hypothetical protein
MDHNENVTMANAVELQRQEIEFLGSALEKADADKTQAFSEIIQLRAEHDNLQRRFDHHCDTIRAYDAVMGSISARWHVDFIGVNPPEAMLRAIELLCLSAITPVPRSGNRVDADKELKEAMEALKWDK